MELIEYIFNLVDPFWATFIASMIPVGELRIGIPLGVIIYEMNLISAFIAGFLGNYLIFSNLIMLTLLTTAMGIQEILMTIMKY